MLSEIPASRNRFVPDSPGASYYQDAFLEDQDATLAEIAEIIGQLRSSCERLTSPTTYPP
jgi:hypothetical protein